MENKVPKVVLTHAGRFHADDVFSSALLKILRPDVEIQRAFQVLENFDGLVYDIGGGEFDHHQQDAEVRENEVPYAAFGLLWRAFGQQLMERGIESKEDAAEEANRFDERFVQPLDEDDNKGTGNSLASTISLFNPNWDDEGDEVETQNICFSRAVDFAVVILNNKFSNIFSIQRAQKVVKAALEKSEDHIVVLPRYAPWKTVLAGSGTEFVVYPSQRGGYCAQIVPEEADSGEPKYRFPAEWAGKREQELPQISGVETLKFCHNGRFLIAIDTLEDAIKACRVTREMAS